MIVNAVLHAWPPAHWSAADCPRQFTGFCHPLDGNEAFTTNLDETASGWEIAAVYIAPVNAPIILVVVLFDYIMSRVRAADSSGETRAGFVLIARLELAMIALYLAYWVPYFVSLLEI